MAFLFLRIRLNEPDKLSRHQESHKAIHGASMRRPHISSITPLRMRHNTTETYTQVDEKHNHTRDKSKVRSE